MDKESELVVVLECYTRSTSDREQRCFGYVERNSDLILKSLGESVELCTTTCEVDAALDDIGVKLRRCGLERRENGLLDTRDRLVGYAR